MSQMLEKARQALNRFFQGRNGADEMCLGLTVGWLLMSLLTRLTGFALFYLAGLAMLGYALFRCLSTKVEARRQENIRYQNWVDSWMHKGKTFMIRQKNRKDYKYFKCPECHQLIRLKRGTGDIEVSCPNCRTKFHQKA